MQYKRKFNLIIPYFWAIQIQSRSSIFFVVDENVMFLLNILNNFSSNLKLKMFVVSKLCTQRFSSKFGQFLKNDDCRTMGGLPMIDLNLTLNFYDVISSLAWLRLCSKIYSKVNKIIIQGIFGSVNFITPKHMCKNL